MAKLYTLQEAADRLGLTPEVFRRKLKTEWVKDLQMIPGNPPHFRAADVDEFARVLGAASDPGLTPGPVGSAFAEDSNDFSFAVTDEAPARSADEPLLVDADDDILAAPRSGKLPKPGSDSDVRLVPATRRPADDQSGPTEEIAIDLSGPSSAVIKPSSGSGKLSAPKSGSKLAGPEAAKIPGPGATPPPSDDSSSEFELSLDPSNDSLELEMNEAEDSSEDVDLGGLLVTDPKGGQSGINLGKPADSGVSLERGGPKTGPLNFSPGPADSDSDIDFELSLDSDDALQPPAAGAPRGVAARSTGPDSDSEFELTLDESSGFSGIVESEQARHAPAGSQEDIFETDFELPSMGDDDSSADLLAEDGTDLEGSGEFEVDEVEEIDLAESDEVVLIDEIGDFEEDDGPSASGALRGVRTGGYDDDVVVTSGPVRTVPMAPARWGALPAVVLLFTLPLMFLGTIMSYEMVRGMWGYHQPTAPGNLVVRGVAESVFDLKPGD